MQVTKNVIRFNNLLVKIPQATKKEFGTYQRIDGV